MNLKRLTLIHFFVALLIISWLAFPTNLLWQMVDLKVFNFFNNMLEASPAAQKVWAYLNYKRTDWVHDVVMVAFFSLYIARGKKGEKLTRTAHFFYCIAIFAFTILIINKALFHQKLEIMRDSPTVVYSDSFRLSKAIDWIYVKDYSRVSFPADHGTTAALFAGSLFFVAGWRMGFLALLYAIFMALPRVVVGAHWVSDVLIGSTAIAVIVLSWAFCTPAAKIFPYVFNRFRRRPNAKRV